MADDPHSSKSMWLGVGKQVISFVVGVVAAAFVLGGTRQKIHDMATWRDAVAPRIERMDSTGTLSFELFHKEYERTQHRQEETLKDLDKRVRELEKNIGP